MYFASSILLIVSLIKGNNIIQHLINIFNLKSCWRVEQRVRLLFVVFSSFLGGVCHLTVTNLSPASLSFFYSFLFPNNNNNNSGGGGSGGGGGINSDNNGNNNSLL